MLIKGIFTSLSGSIGGVTGSHNKGGQYLRARTVPVNPNTADQIRARGDFAAAIASWAVSADKPAWNDFAEEQAWTNRLGDAIQLSGQQAYIGIQSSLLLAGLSVVSVPPPPNTRPVVDVSTIVAEDDGTITVTLATAYAMGDRVVLFKGIPVSVGVTRYKGPWRLVGTAAANAPAVYTGLSLDVGQILHLCVKIVKANGQYSNPVPFRTTVVAA